LSTERSQPDNKMISSAFCINNYIFVTPLLLIC
jgi:hypothetical protein